MLFGSAVDIDLDIHFLVDLISDEGRDIDIEILWLYFEFGLSQQVTVLDLDRSRSLDGLRGVMKGGVSFHPYFVDAIFADLDIAGITAAESSLGVFVTFYIIFVEVFLHQFFGEDEAL